MNFDDQVRALRGTAEPLPLSGLKKQDATPAQWAAKLNYMEAKRTADARVKRKAAESAERRLNEAAEKLSEAVRNGDANIAMAVQFVLLGLLSQGRGTRRKTLLMRALEKLGEAVRANEMDVALGISFLVASDLREHGAP
jgi:hypothetical protein